MRAPFCALILSLIALNASQGLAAAPSNASQRRCVPLLEHLMPKALFKVKGGVYDGLTPEGAKILATQASKLVETNKVANSQLFGLEVVVDLLPKIAVSKSNFLFYGSPGAAKTLSGRVVFNESNIAVTDINALTTKEAIFGGPTRQDIEAGDYTKIQTQGAAINQPFQLINDIQNGNADLLGALGSAIVEGKYFHGARPLDVSNVQSWGFTTNAQLHELIEMFVLSGNASYGPAFLNRLQTKFYFHNWGDTATRIKISRLNAQKAQLQSLANSDPSVANNILLREVPADLNYTALRDFANNVFELTEETEASIQVIAHEIKLKYRAMKDEIDERLKDGDKNTIPYIPSVDLSDRIAGKTLVDFLKASVALDFLSSVYGKDAKTLEKMTKNKIKINPISIWRLYPIFTTVMAKNQTLFDPFAKQILFGAKKDVMSDSTKIIPLNEVDLKATMPSKRDQINYEYQTKEREIFINAFQQELIEKEKTNKLNAQFGFEKVEEWDPLEIDPSKPGMDIEFVLFAAGNENMFHAIEQKKKK